MNHSQLSSAKICEKSLNKPKKSNSKLKNGKKQSDCKDMTIKRAFERVSMRASKHVYSSKAKSKKFTLKGVDGKYVYLGDSRDQSEDESTIIKFSKTMSRIKSKHKSSLSVSPCRKILAKNKKRNKLKSTHRLRSVIKSYDTVNMEISQESTPV